ncbi:unnamed protein product [Cunninghamella blakesleeana]
MKFINFFLVFAFILVLVQAKEYGQQCRKGSRDLNTAKYCRSAAGDSRKDSKGQPCCRLPLSVPNRIKTFQRACTNGGGSPKVCCPYGFSC